MASPATPTGVIRKAAKDDVPEILAMIRELAEYEKDLASCKASEELLYKNLGFEGGPAYAQAVMLCEGEKAVGFALYFYNFSTWAAKPGVYLEDLYVRPESRGKGYGTALLAHLAREVKRIDGGRLDWQVLDWNKPSIDFYKSIGARHMEEWMNMRVDGDGLDRLGELGPKLKFVE
ncbi:hypothetical protein ABW20_dc0103585 [Dactylellina cionopaga]|nr:hypothetical protein ABW20_dc0103585 [Dactylellina cionopaga]